MGSKKDYGSVRVIVQNASLPRGHASIRIQQYVGIITCMGLTAHGLLRSLMTSVDINIFVFSIIYCIGEKNWALHGEQWVYEQVKIVSSRRCVNHFVRLYILEEKFIILPYVIEFPR